MKKIGKGYSQGGYLGSYWKQPGDSMDQNLKGSMMNWGDWRGKELIKAVRAEGWGVSMTGLKVILLINSR